MFAVVSPLRLTLCSAWSKHLPGVRWRTIPGEAFIYLNTDKQIYEVF